MRIFLLDHELIELRHALDLHLVVQEPPLIILFQQDCTDEADDAVLVGEDADDIGRRLTSLLRRSREILECNFVRCWVGNLVQGHVGGKRLVRRIPDRRLGMKLARSPRPGN